MSLDATATNAAGQGGQPNMRLGGWLPHVCLIALAGVLVAVAKAKHLSTEAATAIAFDETAAPDDRIWAMHVAANRASTIDTTLGVDLVKSFLQSGSDKVREAALVVDLCRHADSAPDAPDEALTPLQSAYTYSPLPGGIWAPHRIRCLVLQRRKVGGPEVGSVRRMELAEAQWFLDSLAGNPMPTAKEVSKYFTMRVREAAALNTQKLESKD